MTELERQLMASLKALSEQGEKERKQLVEQVTALSEQVEALAGQHEQEHRQQAALVSDLRKHVRTLASNYKELAGLLKHR